MFGIQYSLSAIHTGWSIQEPIFRCIHSLSLLASFFPARIISSQRCHSININSKALERLFAACRRAYLSIIAHVPMGMRAQILVNAP